MPPFATPLLPVFVSLALAFGLNAVPTGTTVTRAARDLYNRALQRVPAASPRECVVNRTAGATLAAQIIACDNALLGASGTIHVYGGGNLSAAIPITAGHTLWLHAGTYVNTYPDSAAYGSIQLGDNTTLRGDGVGTIIDEGSVGFGAYRIVETIKSRATFSAGRVGVQKGIVVRDIQFKGRKTNSSDGTGTTVGLYNCHDCQVINNWFNSPSAYAVQIGANNSRTQSTAANGYYGENVIITGNTFDQIPSQNVAIISGRNIQVTNNIFKGIQKANLRPSNAFIAMFDSEPNNGNEVLENIVVDDNIFDLHGVATNTNSINYGRIVTTKGGSISRNIIYSDSGTHVNGIVLVNSEDVMVANNTVITSVQSGIAVYASTRLTITGNRLINTGSGGVLAPAAAGMEFEGITNSRITNNEIQMMSSGVGLMQFEGVSTGNEIVLNRMERLDAMPGTVFTGNTIKNNTFYKAGSAYDGIVETAGSNSNIYEGNHAAGVTLVGRSSRNLSNFNPDTGVWSNSRGSGVGGGPNLAAALKGTLTIDPTSVAANTAAVQTFSLAGARVGDMITLKPPTAGGTAGLVAAQVYVRSAGRVAVVFHNMTGRAIDAAAARWDYQIVR